MHCYPRKSPAAVLFICATLLSLVAGCAGLMKPPPYDVSVDGISGPGGVGGTSYQLIARDAMAPRDPLLHERVVTCVKAAFADKGMFEAPAGTQPDIFITIDYGLGNTIPAMNGPPAVEKFLYMSARKEREDPRAGTRGEELWNVRTSFAIPGVAIDAPMPVTISGVTRSLNKPSRSRETRQRLPEF